jgi:hypothetical protein
MGRYTDFAALLFLRFPIMKSHLELPPSLSIEAEEGVDRFSKEIECCR